MSFVIAGLLGFALAVSSRVFDWSRHFSLVVAIVTIAVYVVIATPVLFLVGPNHSRR
jgi:hypothetical protein